MNSTDKENLHKEIDLIQDCIKRMASNSFLLKGWTISLIAVVLALSAKQVNPYFLCFIILVPLISFWYLDAFFLYTEKLYRKMYSSVIDKRIAGDNEKMYDLNPHRYKNALIKPKKNNDAKDELETVASVMWSTTLRCFYFIPVVLVVLSMLTVFFTQEFCDLSKEMVIKASSSEATNNFNNERTHCPKKN